MSSSPSFNIANAIIENMLNEFPPLSNENSSGVINQFNLTRLYPNPFNPVLNIDFDINQAGWVKVNISDITGSMVKTVYEGYEGVGKHYLSWDSDKLPSGTYFVTLEFDFCYPESQAGNSFSFVQHNGDLNGGNFQVLLIEMSTSW